MSAPSISEVRAIAWGFSVRALLGATVVLAAALHAVLALRIQSPWIVPDELIYSELAKSLGEGGLPAIRDEASFAYGIGYSALIAPAWLMFDDIETAYGVAKVINALVMSLAALPAYYLARRFVDDRSALVVSALTVAVPSLVYAGTLLTEVALYPACLLVLLAIVAALERPAVVTQVGALGAIALASAIKVLAAVLLIAYVASIVLYHWLDTREGSGLRGRLRSYSPTWLALAGAVAAAALLAVASGRTPGDALGAYAVVLGNIDVLAVPWLALLHVAELDLYIAVIPFIATVIVVFRGLRSDASQRERLFLALLVPACAALVLAVAAYASTPFPGGGAYPENVARLHERSTFLLAPLFFIGLMLALTGPAMPRRRLVITATVAAALPGVIPLERFSENANFQALALVPWIPSQDALVWPLGCIVMTGTLATLYVARGHLGLVVIPVAGVFLLTTLTAQVAMEWSGNWTKERAWGSSASWIDDAAEGETVSVLWAETGGGRFVDSAARHRVVWLGELFNRSVGPVFELGTPMPYGLPSTRVRLNDGRVVLEDGRPAALGALVLAPCHVRVDGEPIARDPATGAVVVRLSGRVRAQVLELSSCPASQAS